MMGSTPPIPQECLFQSQNWDSFYSEQKSSKNERFKSYSFNLRIEILFIQRRAIWHTTTLAIGCFNLRIEILFIQRFPTRHLRNSLRNSFNLRIEILFIQSPMMTVGIAVAIAFQSQNWDSFYSEGYGVTLAIKEILPVSISELRFFLFREHKTLSRRIPLLVSISELRFFLFRVVKALLVLGIVQSFNLRIEILFIQRHSMPSALQGYSESFQSQNWDSFYSERIQANTQPSVVVMVSISELRFFLFRATSYCSHPTSWPLFQSQNWDSFYSEIDKAEAAEKASAGFNLRIEILFIQRVPPDIAPLKSTTFQSQNWDSFYSEVIPVSQRGSWCCDVSISELRFFLFRAKGFRWAKRGIYVSISELRFFLFRAHLPRRPRAPAHRFQSQNWDSFYSELFRAKVGETGRLYVSISELRFFLFRVGFSLKSFVSTLLSTLFQSQNWDSFYSELSKKEVMEQAVEFQSQNWDSFYSEILTSRKNNLSNWAFQSQNWDSFYSELTLYWHLRILLELGFQSQNWDSFYSESNCQIFDKFILMFQSQNWDSFYSEIWPERVLPALANQFQSQNWDSFYSE